MKKLGTLFLLAALIVLNACSKTEISNTSQETNESEITVATEELNITGISTSQQQQMFINPFEAAGMPQPFNEIQDTGGGLLAEHLFTMPCSEGIDNFKIDGIPNEYVYEFVEDVESVWAWFEEKSNTLKERPATSLMDYPNLYSFIKTFNVPIDELGEYMKRARLEAIEIGLEDSHFTFEEIELIVSLDEAALMEHFVSKYSIYHDGKIFTPMWFYLHTADDCRENGITPEMVEDKLRLYAEIPFSREAVNAFEEKLSVFIGEEVSLNSEAYIN